MARSGISTLAYAAAALVAVAALAWLGLTGFAWTDYEVEAAPAFAALARGDVTGFLGAAQANGGSLVLRAPFAVATGWLGGGELAVYRAVALPCLLVGAALGVVLARRSPRHAWLVLALAAANPVTLRALEIGHPEELLSGVLCVGAVLAAAGPRPLAAGLLLGLRRPGRPPLLTLGAVLATGATFEWLPGHLSPDDQSIAYLAWMLPLTALLARAALPARAPARRAVPSDVLASIAR